jgi:uncharacterized membrane protein YjjP (DUF1212 family)
MTIEREIITLAATGLHANGQQTEETEKSVAALARVLATPAQLIARWDELHLAFGSSSDARFSIAKLTAANVGINRVVAINGVIDKLQEHTVAPSDAVLSLHRDIAISPLPTHLFVLACATGAVALAITFGAGHVPSLAAIFLSAGLGGYLRRYLGGKGANNFAQAFIAALLAGIIGSIGVRTGISSDLRLIAVCPCMVLVPGPHLLNGSLDLLEYRIPLGTSRIGFAMLTLAAISAGLLLGLATGDTSLPAAPIGRDVPIWLTVIAAGMAAACYGVFFSMPLKLLVWPISAGMISSAIRWIALSVSGLSPATGAAVASFVVGILLLPVARRFRLPFAGIGFASIVSLMPGVLVFRMVSGLVSLGNADNAAVPHLIKAVANDGITAVSIVLALTIGIVVPKHVFDAVMRHRDGEAGK